MREALREAWELARVKPALGGRLRSYAVVGARTGLRAVVSPEGFRGLLVPLNEGQNGQVPRAMLPGQGCALEAEVATYLEGNASIRSFLIWCRDPNLNEVYVAFCEALIERSPDAIDPGSAAEDCYAEFRHLFAGPGSIDKSGVVGLIGELLFLLDLLEISPEAIATWCADAAERHDFRRGNCSVEVKATLRSAAVSPVVRISAIDQLEPPAAGELYLHCVRLEEVASGAVTLPDLVARIMKRVDGSGADRLRARADRAGIAAPGLPTFSLIGRTTYLVGSGFPRLTPSRLVAGQLDTGVRGVQYDLDLDNCVPFRVEHATALAALTAGIRR